MFSMFWIARKSNKASKKRKRGSTVSQRRAANIRERRRMHNLNEGFDRLRTKVSDLWVIKIGLIWTQDEKNIDKMKILTKSVVWPNMNLKYFVWMKVFNKFSVNSILTGGRVIRFSFQWQDQTRFLLSKLEDKTWLTIVAALRSVILVHIKRF